MPGFCTLADWGRWGGSTDYSQSTVFITTLSTSMNVSQHWLLAASLSHILLVAEQLPLSNWLCTGPINYHYWSSVLHVLLWNETVRTLCDMVCKGFGLPGIATSRLVFKPTLSVSMAIFPGGPGLNSFTGAEDDGSGGDNCSYKTCKAPVKSSPPTNQCTTFCRPDVLPVAKPTMSKHWREILSLNTTRKTRQDMRRS